MDREVKKLIRQMYRPKRSINMNDPKYARLKENNADFTTTAKSGLLLRTAAAVLLHAVNDKTISNRLVKVMRAVLKCSNYYPGQRRIEKPHTSMLENFEFNSTATLSSRFRVPYAASIDIAQGEASIEVDKFDPTELIVAPRTTTHFKIVAAALTLNFDRLSYDSELFETSYIPYFDSEVEINAFRARFAAGTSDNIFLLLGIQFFVYVADKFYPVGSLKSNPLQIVKTG